MAKGPGRVEDQQFERPRLQACPCRHRLERWFLPQLTVRTPRLAAGPFLVVHGPLLRRVQGKQFHNCKKDLSPLARGGRGARRLRTDPKPPPIVLVNRLQGRQGGGAACDPTQNVSTFALVNRLTTDNSQLNHPFLILSIPDSNISEVFQITKSGKTQRRARENWPPRAPRALVRKICARTGRIFWLVAPCNLCSLPHRNPPHVSRRCSGRGASHRWLRGQRPRRSVSR